MSGTIKKKSRPISVSLSKLIFDDTGKNTSIHCLIEDMEFQLKPLVKLLMGFPFTALDRYPLDMSMPASSFRLVKASSMAVRIGGILTEFKLSFHGDPKYWKWALIASGLVKR